MRPGKRKLLDKTKLVKDPTDQLERIKASIRAKVEHPFRVIKRQFGHVKVRYRGLAKNTAQTAHAVCAVQPMDGAARVDGNAGMSAPPKGQTAVKQARKRRNAASQLAEFVNLLDQAASAHLKAHCADLP
jgi:hypothetical protein